MKLAGLKEYLALAEARRGDVDGNDIMNKWMDSERAYNFEGSTGVRNLEKLVRALGYRDISDFLMDNPGAIQAIVEFVTEWVERNDEWAEKLTLEESVITEGLDYSAIAAKLSALGMKADARCVAAFIEGGDAPGFKKFMDDLTKVAGYDDGATSFDENKEFWKKLGVTKAQYNKACKDSF
jgi:hypothetical protein